MRRLAGFVAVEAILALGILGLVAAMSVTQRFSTAGSRESCWALEKRWISSRKSTVSLP